MVLDLPFSMDPVFRIMGAYGIMRIKLTQAVSGPSLDLLRHGSAGNPA